MGKESTTPPPRTKNTPTRGLADGFVAFLTGLGLNLSLFTTNQEEWFGLIYRALSEQDDRDGK